MKSVGAFQAKTHLGELLDRVERGESVTITRHGKPVAQLIPTLPVQKRDRGEVIRNMLEFGKGRKLQGASGGIECAGCGPGWSWLQDGSRT